MQESSLSSHPLQHLLFVDFLMMTILTWASQVVLVVKNLPAYAGNLRHWFDPWVRKIPWRRKWQPTPVFLSRRSQGQRSLVGYSPWGCKSQIQLKLLKNNKALKGEETFICFSNIHSSFIEMTYQKYSES